METPITIHADELGTEVVIRKGDAAPILLPKRISLAGTITAPADWFTGKELAGYNFDPSLCHIVVNRDERTISFVSNDHESSDTEGGHTIVGRLKEATSLSRLGVNRDNSRYTAQSLGDLLKMNGLMFADREDNRRVVTALQNFKARVTTEIEQNDDLKGNKLYHFEQNVASEFNLSFTLNTPIFQGQDAVKFLVDIRFDVRDRAVTYWLESVELKEAMDEAVDLVIDRELERFEARIAMIEK